MACSSLGQTAEERFVMLIAAFPSPTRWLSPLERLLDRVLDTGLRSATLIPHLISGILPTTVDQLGSTLIMPNDTRQKLLQAAHGFCDAFATQRPPEEIFSHFSSSDDVRVLEHGLPKFALFVGREFRGQGGLHNYFAYISSSLKYENMRFENFIVDPESLQVSCRGHARFTWSSTNQEWDETFAYMLGFDDQFKVKSYEIWADTGAAYLAGRGELES